MKKSIFLKIFTGYFLIILALCFFILIFSLNTIKNYYISHLTSNLKNIGLTLELRIITFIEQKQSAQLDSLIKKLSKDINTRITVITPEGVVLADSEEDPAVMDNHRQRPEIKQALSGTVGSSLRFSNTVEKNMLYVALPVRKDGKVIGVLRTSMFLEDINNLLGTLKRKILHVILLVIIISLPLISIFSKTLSNPIKKLAQASEEVASGNFDVMVFLKNKDQLKDLADSFNYMTQKIKTLFTDLSLQKEELNSVISSIQEGLVVLDEKEKILLSNESFRHMAQKEEVKDKFFWEILREVKLGDLIKKITEQKKNFSEEIEINQRMFLCSANFIAAKSEVVLIFHDITEIKNLEKVKKDFVVNISHELRTPLTAIKGYVETLEEDIDRKHKHYLSIIMKHTDRLINIVQDLLLLSELEEKGVKLQFEKVGLKTLIENILKVFMQRLKEKNLELRLNIEEHLPDVKADPFKLEQVFINLIDNAIKYTEQGEIIVSLSSQNDYLKIEIQDTGIGIPKELLERIFERFYVVDKSRSKKLGGTGLGLSIVKHIILLHNGKIDVESTPGVGTKFIIMLPSYHS